MTPPVKSSTLQPAPVAEGATNVDPAAARQLWAVLAELQDALRMIEKKLS